MTSLLFLKKKDYTYLIGIKFSGTIGLASHRDRVHSQQLPCPHCEKLLPSKVKLEYHMIRYDFKL